jgi:hypothetical protein
MILMIQQVDENKRLIGDRGLFGPFSRAKNKVGDRCLEAISG